MTDVRLPQLAREVLVGGSATVRVPQVARETLAGGEATFRVGQLARATLAGGAAEIRVAQFWRAILRSQRDSPYPNFPVRLFCPPALGVRLSGGAVFGGRSPGFDEAVEAMDAGATWVMEFAETQLNDRDRVLAWRDFTTACDFGAMPATVPLWDRLYQPFAEPAYDGDSTFGAVIWRDFQTWEADQVQAAVTVQGERESTVLSFSYAGAALQGGEHFSLYGNRYGWRLYRLVREVEPGRWEIRPPLRDRALVHAAVNFDEPRCTMRPDGDASELLELLRFGRGSVTFVESFARYP